MLNKTLQKTGCFVLAGIFAFSIGCSAQKKPLNTTPKNTSFKKVYNPPAAVYPRVGPRVITPVPPVQPPMRSGMTAMANEIAKKAKTVKGVKSANVMVAGVGGKTAFVGLGLDPGITGAKATKIKKEVATKLKNYPGITKVLVSANPGIVQRIKSTMNGTPPNATIMDLTNRIKAER